MISTKHRSRLILITIMIIGSALYAALVAADESKGTAVGVGYVAVILTVFVYNEYWSRHDR